jgi:hypothetical protein
MSEDDVLFGYRLRVLDYAGPTSVSEAYRVFGIHRSTFYVWNGGWSGMGLRYFAHESDAGRGCPTSTQAISFPQRLLIAAGGGRASAAQAGHATTVWWVCLDDASGT